MGKLFAHKPDSKLFALFTGQQDYDKILRNGDEFCCFVSRLNLDTVEMEDYRCSIHLSDLERIKNAFAGIGLRSLPTAEYLLMILWIRENLFTMDSLQDSEISGFVKNAFAISGTPIDGEDVPEEFQALHKEGYISVGHTAVGDDEKRDYFLDPKGSQIGEETFVRMQIIASASDESSPTDAGDGQIVELLKKQNNLIEKGTAATKKGFASLKLVDHKSLAELVKVLPPLRQERENDYWILAKTAAQKTGETLGNLNKQRQRGEMYLYEGLEYGRDPEGRIWCHVSKSRKVFYHTDYLL